MYNKSKMANSRHLEEINKLHISATVQPIGTKFGMDKQTAPLNSTGS